jgi:NAD(P)-dependent dehydrogenase (short-subunit alcohol dehydrogenase family)
MSTAGPPGGSMISQGDQPMTRTSARAAVVVGGASGIGAAVAERQRAAGLDVVTWDITDSADLYCDITECEQVDAATASTLDRLGRAPDLVTITAGIGHGGMLLDLPADEWDRVLAVNAKGPWLVMRALAAPMLEASGGSIVATSSISARLADRTMGLYCASKAALDMIVRVAALEWAPGLRVNGVAPGVTDTPMLGRAPRDGAWLRGVASRTALRRLGSAEDIAEVVNGLHDMNWITGEILACDGGLAGYSPIDPLGPPTI